MLSTEQAREKIQSLIELKSQFEDLIDRARDIVRGTGLTGKRAESYWIGNIEGCLDDRGCMVTLQDTIDEFQDGEIM